MSENKSAEALAANEMPLPIALRLLAQQIKEGDGLRDNQMRHHRMLERAAAALTSQAPGKGSEALPEARETVEHDEKLLDELCVDLQNRTEMNHAEMWGGLKMVDVQGVMKTYAMQMLRRYGK